jgi:uncharacterized membrane protein YfcA
MGYETTLMVLFGTLVGFAGGYAGIGGAPFLVAALVLFLGMPQHAAQGTVLAVMLGPMSLPGVWVMRDRVRLLKGEIVVGVLTYAVFSNFGARIAFALNTEGLELLFGALLVGLGVYYLTRRMRPEDDAVCLTPDGPTLSGGMFPFNLWTVGVASAGIGVAGGLFGIGAGVLMVPLFISLFGLHKDDARALSLTILLPPVSIGAVIEYAAHDAIDWWAAGLIFILYFVTNRPGAQLGRRHDSRRFVRVMGCVLGLLGAAQIAILGWPF